MISAASRHSSSSFVSMETPFVWFVLPNRKRSTVAGFHHLVIWRALLDALGQQQPANLLLRRRHWAAVRAARRAAVFFPKFS
jgi:hypothetical protein